MIRDDKMMELVAAEKEPITPFIHRVRSLYEDRGVSSVLVIGGSGDYFDVADCVVMMDCYRCRDVTKRAKEIAASANGSSRPSAPVALRHDASSRLPFGSIVPRRPAGESFRPNGRAAVRSRSVVSYGDDVELDLGGLEQIVDVAQTNAISLALQRIAAMAAATRTGAGGANGTLRGILDGIEATLDGVEGLDALSPGEFHGGLARPRAYEIAGAANRLRREGSMVQER
mmetsp:Transcript_3963/g.10953  ORF Transcript_3963/g.10953 Transcript_3963/m.10953 type:complete len:229 (-) Transcript_3963:524-1210(-)